MVVRRRFLVLPVVLLLLPASGASASQFIDRGYASGVRLAVNAKGEALLTYREGASFRHVLAWGAINARHPSSGRPQVRLRRDYSGRGRYWQSFGGQCGRYDGPKLAFLVAACAAPDGSYWAVQSWRVQLPDLGMLPWLSYQSEPELHLSHWSGPLAQLEVWTDWIYGRRNHHLFGRVTYDGQPVHGFTSTRLGAPTDRYGRLIYLDTWNSRYGKGWRRENAFLAHSPRGLWCYSFLARDPTKGYAHPAGLPEHSARAGQRREVPDHPQRPGRDTGRDGHRAGPVRLRPPRRIPLAHVAYERGSRTPCSTPSSESTRSAASTSAS